jgi:hypothetical protein
LVGKARQGQFIERIEQVPETTGTYNDMQIKRNSSCLLSNYILSILSFMHFILLLSNLQGFAARKKACKYFFVVNFSMLFQNQNSIERDETHHVVLTYDSVFFFFFPPHVAESESKFISTQVCKSFLFCMHKKFPHWPALECNTGKSTELGNEHT